MASVAQYETEVRGGADSSWVEARRAAGKPLGGRKPGTRARLTKEKERAIRQMHRSAESVSAIARAVGLSRPTIYKVIG